MNTDSHAKTQRRKTTGTKVPLNTAIGNRDLCAWQPVRGVWWVLIRNPNHGRRLAQRKDGRLVARGVAGGFLRTFEFAGRADWGAELLARYTAAEKATGSSFGGQICPRTNPDLKTDV
jgi:hypothetical protein